MSGSFDTGLYLKEGWKLFKGSASTLIVATILYFVVTLAANMIPVVNIFAGILLPGALMGGMYYVIMDAGRGVEFNFSRIFDGFRLHFVHLTLVYALSSIFIFAAMLIPMLIGGVVFYLMAGPTPDVTNAEPLIAYVVFVALLSILPAILVSGWYMFSYLFVVDRNMGFWEAMEASRRIGFENHLQIFFLMLIIILILIAGFFAFGIGVLVSFPLAMCVTYKAYENLSAPAARRTQSRAAPPPLPPEGLDEERPAERERAISPGLKGYVHCFVFIEGADPSENDMINIIKAGAPEAMEQQPPPVITGHGVDFWPSDNDELKRLIQEAIKGYRESNPAAPRYADSSAFKIKVWKGRDTATGTNMALASVIAKAA